jgi:hypothetical protein
MVKDEDEKRGRADELDGLQELEQGGPPACYMPHEQPHLVRVQALHIRIKNNTPQEKKKRTMRSTFIPTQVEFRATKGNKTRWEELE